MAPPEPTPRRAGPSLLRLGLRLAVRRLVLLVLLVSLAVSLQSLATIARSPGISPFVDRGAEGIAAAMDRAMARDATPGRIAARLADLLAEEDRNWIAIRAVEEVAAERGIPLPPDLTGDIAAAWAADSGFLARARDCAACAYDPADCTLSATLICQAPMIVTPAGDVAAVANEGFAYATGGEVDEINLALGLVGLGATGLVVATGGTSLTLDAAAGVARLAHRMDLMSAPLRATLRGAAREGVDWAALPAARSTDALRAAIRGERLAPLAAIVADTGRIAARTDTATALHLLRHVDDAADARRIANATEVLGPRAVGRMEVLGKSRFLRATVRLSNLALELVAGLVGLMLSAASLAGSMLSNAVLRGLGRLARRL
ncbi:hypothetical protein [Frigidibacter oleivorans]|uniref:hypothetical protein n=1 Tax=Frigidibacter oleivorans TaxID=2487129 RepID=UPI0013DF2A99|nr:hypothetical protein [Frigidibacter oleivorans]